MRKNWYAVSEPDQSDWSAKRIASFAQYKSQQRDTPEAVLSIKARDIEVAVYPDTTRGALEAGVSWVTGTAAPGSAGNIVIAGHRDSFFRKLEAIPVGTEIQLEGKDSIQVYEIESIRIVDALDTEPLEPFRDDVLTLITCYPFYYQGYAPDRYIVRARLVQLDSRREVAD